MKQKGINLASLLKPHSETLALGFAAVVGEGIANLLEPWPLKLVLDNVLRSRPIPQWLHRVVLVVAGDDKLAVLKFAVLAVLSIAVVGAVCSYTEKYVT